MEDSDYPLNPTLLEKLWILNNNGDDDDYDDDDDDDD